MAPSKFEKLLLSYITDIILSHFYRNKHTSETQEKMTVTAAEDQKLRPRSGRKPLQPINSLATPLVNRKTTSKPIGKQECIDKNQNQISSEGAGDLNKENQTYPVANIESLDASLADELNAIRKKLERLRLDKERTEKMLSEREMILDVQTKEIQHRGETQKMLEIEVDRLYRLKELKSYCMVRTYSSVSFLFLGFFFGY